MSELKENRAALWKQDGAQHAASLLSSPPQWLVRQSKNSRDVLCTGAFYVQAKGDVEAQFHMIL